ncbi:Ribosomal RNA-processing protein 7 [Ascosphaera acerosa]|nr:Ribosomal RNA-processing protein 7 [Ascosphaera acerosa]
MTIPTSISDYTVLPVQLPALPSLPEPATHYIYLRPHEPKLPSPDSARSLFLVNVPITSTEAHFRHLFGTQLAAGRVERVSFQDAHLRQKKSLAAVAPKKASTHTGKKRKRNQHDTLDELQETLDTITLPSPWDRELQASGSHAVVVFVDRASMEASYKAAKKASKAAVKLLNSSKSSKSLSSSSSASSSESAGTGGLIVWGEGVEGTDKVQPLGAQRYLAHHKLRYPPRADLLRTVQDYMTIFSRIEDTRHRIATAPSEPDEDGFVTVTRGAKVNNPAREEELAELLRKKKEQEKGLEDFYRFQMREKRKERQNELLRKFEEDKRTVQEMRQRRGKVRPE